jgi:hypothetical protein
MVVPYSDMPAPGAPGHITAVANLEGETRSDAARLSDQSVRSFVVKLQLVKQVTLPDAFHGDFTKEDGASHVKAEQTLKIATSFGDFEIDLNARSEMSLIRMNVEARHPMEARNKVYETTAIFLDRLSFLANVPIFTGLMAINDETNKTTTIEVVGPEQEVVLNFAQEQLFNELAPVYALYREFKNSSSAYYRFLCLFKIMEGVLGVLRKRARDEYKKSGLKFSVPKETVPDHRDTAPEFRCFIGRPMKDFCDNVLTKQYRDVASHFLVQENVVLRVSSAGEWIRFAEMAFLCDLCVRILISNHENLLRRLADARLVNVG